MEVEFIAMNGNESAQFPQMWPGFESLLNFFFDLRVFFGFLGLFSSTETNILKFKIQSRSAYKKNHSESFPR